MAEKKGVGHAYNVDFLNVVFAASSLFLFLSVVWMVWDDFDRDWKNTQRRFAQLEYEVTQAQLPAGGGGGRPEQAAAARRRSRQAAAQQKSPPTSRRSTSCEDQLAEADKTGCTAPRSTTRLPEGDLRPGSLRLRGVAGRRRTSSADGEGPRRSPSRSGGVTELNLAMREGRPPRRPQSRRSSSVYTGQVAAVAEADRRAARPRRRGCGKRLDVIAPSVVKDYFRNAPLLDFMAPTIKVQQIILPNVVDDVNFIRVPKMDRCRTCHLAIDKKGYEKYPQPFTTHPNLDTYLGGASPHPIDTDRLHRVPRGHGAVGELRRRGAHAGDRAAEGGVGGEVPLGGAAPVGLPDAADEA